MVSMPPPISRPTSDRHAELIARALAHAESHLDEPLTAETLADCAAMSRHHFHRVFRAYVGSTRSITLTSEGTLFLERSRRILAEIEAA
jgi:AraC family transcriptional regulator